MDNSCLKTTYLQSEDLGWKLQVLRGKAVASSCAYGWLKHIHQRQRETETGISLPGLHRQQHPGLLFAGCILH